MHVYEKVQEYISLHELNEKSVAKAANIPNVTFNAILTGKRKLYADELKAICVALEVGADVFIDQTTACL